MSVYARFIREPDSSKSKNSEVMVKYRKCGTERLDKNPAYTRNNQVVSVECRDVFLVKKLSMRPMQEERIYIRAC